MRGSLTLAALCAAVAWAGPVRADDEPPDHDVVQELREEAPAMVAPFLKAEQLAETDPQTSLALYAEVARGTTAFSEAQRRACRLALQASTREHALRLCEGAIDRLRSPQNLTTLAEVYATKVDGRPLDEARARALLEEALADEDASGLIDAEACLVEATLDPAAGEACARKLAGGDITVRRLALLRVLEAAAGQKDAIVAARVADELSLLDPDEILTWTTMGTIAAERRDSVTIRRAAAQLRRLAPRGPDAPYLESLAHEIDGNQADAERTLREAAHAGLAAEEIERVRHRRALRARQVWLATGPQWLMVGLFGTWLVLVLGTLGLAKRLSRRLLDELADGNPLPPNDLLPRVKARARLLYGAALRLLPVLLGDVAWIAASVVFVVCTLQPWRLLHHGQAFVGEPLPIYGFLIAGIVSSAWRLTMPKAIPDLGLPLPLGDHPVFASILGEVAEAVGVAPIQRVFLTPGEHFRLEIRGGLVDDIRGTAEPRLVVGAELLRRVDIQAFRALAVQAHAHLAGDEIPGATFAIAVRDRYRQQRRAREQLTWWNPARLFAQLADDAFHRASLAAVRFQTLRGDRLAVECYGLPAFERALRALDEPNAAGAATPAANVADPYRGTDDGAARSSPKGRRNADATSPLPPLADRLARVERTPRREGSEDFDEDARRSAWLLLSNRRELKERLLGSRP